ncbi:MAG: T9SS type A sorting domain-containing protein [Bacteroidetes bacterium]|nr:T9SS type A sorting domain-containing protein [Bacteroidota bacterium]MBS1931029.1 T9SS type A sorting domain-containing protein [Bacteroidota bacterium]
MKLLIRQGKFNHLYAFLALLLLCKISHGQSDACGTATVITTRPTCITGISQLTAQTLSGNTQSSPNIATSCTGTPGADVWYSFIANSTNPTINLSSLGTGFQTTSSRVAIQILSGGCGSLTSVSCARSAGTAGVTTFSTTASSLTIGVTYFIRIYTLTVSPSGANWGYTICVTDPAPSNDACSGATTITSSTICTNTTGNVYASTNEAPVITGDCAGSVVYDLWYRFIAQTTNPTISLSNIGTNFTNPGLELLSGACGSQTALYCGTTSIAANFLTPGTAYYIRVYSSAAIPPTSPANSGFDICVTDPISVPPFNDECVNAINLPVGVNACSSIPTTIAGATASAVAIAPCTGPVGYDVWYKFTATSNSSTITLGSIGSNFTSPNIQILSGGCGSLGSVACGTSPLAFASTVGTTYYIRVYSTSSPAPNGNANFNICVNGGANAPVRFGNSYVNISKKTNGGVVQPGDTLEIRFTINHTSVSMSNLRYVDNVPSNTTMLTTSNDSIRVITNEGLTYKRYTLTAGDDAATYTASPGAGEYNIRMNLGFGGTNPGIPVNNTSTESASATGSMASGDRPKGGGGLLFAIAYRVKVTGVAGDTINLFPGQFIYNNAGTDVILTATPFKILISNPLTLCTNSTGLNNAVENGGTFGSGNTLNRNTDLTYPISGYTFVPNVSSYVAVNDGRYAIVKNISPRSSTVRDTRRPPNCNIAPTLSPNDPYSCNNKMFTGHWYVDGDHSGTNNSIGNLPPDANTPGGYMLEVNADYVASEVYRQTVSNLCPNTYYEFSAWIRNICPTCGMDSTGTSTYKPGVLPNLTFNLDNLDYYNTGEVDTLGWLKKGFVFKTAPAQTSATFSIRNNSQGGGGNDWALDDIAIATCLPTMNYSPSINPLVCSGNSLDIYDTVGSYFNNYTYFKWGRSTDAGVTWSDITLPVDTSLVFDGTSYKFITKYTIPPANTTMADSADLYRVVVATTSGNLSNQNCLYTDASSIITLNVSNCVTPLGLDLLSFSGKLNKGNATLQWITSKENEPVFFDIEKSIDGINFIRITTISGHGNNTDNNSYQYTDPIAISDKAWYRILMYDDQVFKKYSRTILLNGQASGFSLNNVINPFSNKLDFEISISQNSMVDAALITLLGKQIRKESFNVYEGTNSLSIQDTNNLAPGMYILQVKNKDVLINWKVIKK